MNGVFVTGIGTDVGKTIVSAGLCWSEKWTYWKPFQAGREPQTDTQRVQGLVPGLKIVPEHCVLETPASPHWAAEIENVKLELGDMEWPVCAETILVEGAGGPLVPINNSELVIDVAVKFQLPVILVVRHYLGSINHTLGAIEAIRSRGLQLLGLVISGSEHPSSEMVITQMKNTPILARIAEFKTEFDPEKHWTWIQKPKI